MHRNVDKEVFELGKDTPHYKECVKHGKEMGLTPYDYYVWVRSKSE